jgi:hypothetical protein
MAGNNRKVVILQDRDLHLLRELAVMRVIDREQAKLVGGFGSTTRVNTRLLALTQCGYLRRFFWGEPTGARKGLYALSAKGAKFVGVPERGPRRRRDQVLAADYFSVHQLQINNVYCTLKYRQAPQDVTFVRWVSFYEPIEGTKLIPDGYAELEIPSKRLALFFEIDLGTEHQAKWQEKVRQYLAYAASGHFTGQFGREQFRTLVIANSEPRLTKLRGATAGVTEKIFRFTTSERIAQETFWGAIWQKPAGQQREVLI